jgi:hypothetical protein
MTRLLSLAIMGLFVAACSPDHDHHYKDDHHFEYANCSAELSCDTCTAVVGCGWCEFDEGGGRCASGPKACGDNFRWNWNPDSCPANEPATDAGATEPEPAADAGGSDAEPATDAESDAEPATDAESDAEPTTDAETCTAPAPVPPGCAQSFGGTLCGAGQYTLGCSGSSAPEGCTRALTEGMTTHYCCRCE